MAAGKHGIRFCANCGQRITSPGPRRFCSFACYNVLRYRRQPNERHKTHSTIQCAQCRATFRPWQGKKRGQRFCSLRCFHESLRNTKPLAERLWENVKKLEGESACWVWTGAVRYNGYGHIRIRTGISQAVWRATHRIAWELTCGPIPEGLEVCHRCDNPLCVRLDHLFLGTHADNMTDCRAKGRHPRWLGSRSRNSERATGN